MDPVNILLLIVLLISSAFAGTAKVLLLKGEASFNGQKLQQDSVVNGKGEFVLGDKSYVKLLLETTKITIALGANSTSTIDLNQDASTPEINLVKGAARWLTGTQKLRGGGIKTANAITGVRGTDFFVSYNPVLGETEVVCFDGNILLVNKKNKSDFREVGKNQWGGIGGRFGRRLSEILSIPDVVVNSFKTNLPLE